MGKKTIPSVECLPVMQQVNAKVLCQGQESSSKEKNLQEGWKAWYGILTAGDTCFPIKK